MSALEFIRSNVALFSGIDDEELLSISRIVGQQSFQKGQTVLFKGSTVDGLHIVATGKVGVYTKANKSANPVQVAELGPGEVFGETSIVEMGTADATVKSAEDGTVVLIVPQNYFRDLVSRNPELSARTRALIDARRPQPRASASAA